VTEILVQLKLQSLVLISPCPARCDPQSIGSRVARSQESKSIAQTRLSVSDYKIAGWLGDAVQIVDRS
jgi:hypothetical protein